MTAVYSSSPSRMEKAKVCLPCAILYLVLLVVAVVERLKTRLLGEDGKETPPRRSIRAEIGERVSVAISYGLMARSMLQTFAEDGRPKRLS